MEGLQNVAFLVVTTTKNILFGLYGNPILTAQPNSIATNLDTYAPDARPPRGGGPEIITTVGLLRTINPKLSPTKGPWCVTFGGRCELPRPVRSQ